MGIVAGLLGSAIIGGGAAAYSANKQSGAASQAAQLGAQSADQMAQVAREQLQYIKQQQAPYQAIGTQALNALGAEFGFNPYQAPQPQNVLAQGQTAAVQYRPTSTGYDGYADAPGSNYSGMGMGNAMRPSVQQPQLMASPVQNNYKGFQADPGYQFRLQEGQRAINNSLLAQGLGLSGAQLRASQEYGQGLASQEYGNWFNRLSGLAGIGQNATNNALAQSGQAFGGMQNALAGQGNALAQGAIGQGNAYANLGQNIGGIASGTMGNYMFAKQMGLV